MGTFIFSVLMLGAIWKIVDMMRETKIREEKKARIERIISSAEKSKESRKSGIERIRENSEKAFNTDEFRKEFRKSLKEKGDNYERYVSKYFKDQGYTIAEHGLDNGKKDHGIDLIAKKEKEIIFIQCKNWKESEEHKIDHRNIKEFIGNCTAYMEKNPMFTMCTIKRYFAVSEEIMDYSAEKFISQNPQSIQKLLLEME